MKLKYYLRGLGIGIVVTAAVLSVSSKGHIKELTDAQIKIKAKELGMVEESLLSDVLDVKAETKAEVTRGNSVSDNNSNSNDSISNNSLGSETEASDETGSSEKTGDMLKQIAEDAKKNVTDTKVTEETETKSKTDVSQETENIVITVASGESSVSICRKLEAAGLIDSASKYDQYLCQNGYDKKICTGNHSIANGATKEEIAKEITSK